MEEEPAAMTPCKRKIAECVDGILSADKCPVCHSSEHKLVDCKSQDVQKMVRMLKEMAESEGKATRSIIIFSRSRRRRRWEGRQEGQGYQRDGEKLSGRQSRARSHDPIDGGQNPSR